jgi:hypothetical protein
MANKRFSRYNSTEHARYAQKLMKNIQIIDDAEKCVYDIFAATDKEFALIFPRGHDIAFNDEVFARGKVAALDRAFTGYCSTGWRIRRSITPPEKTPRPSIPTAPGYGRP